MDHETQRRLKLTQAVNLMRKLLTISSAPISEELLAQMLPPGIELEEIGARFEASPDPGEKLVRHEGYWRLDQDGAEYWTTSKRRDALPQTALEALASVVYNQHVERRPLLPSATKKLEELGWLAEAGTGSGWRVTTEAFIDELGIETLEDLMLPEENR